MVLDLSVKWICRFITVAYLFVLACYAQSLVFGIQATDSNVLGSQKNMHILSASRYNAIVATVIIVTMFLPMIAIHFYDVDARPEKQATGEITVGIAVILRAATRRLFRGVTTNVMRTTVGAFGRTSARAVTRRFVKFVGGVLFSSIVQESMDESSEVKEKPRKVSYLVQLFSLLIGFVTLCLSFWGILHVITPEQSSAILGSKGLSEFEVILLAGIPLLAYAGLHKVLGWFLGVRTIYRTELDGLLLQGYFTGAGSFLPLTTDVEYHGDKKSKCNLAMISLLGMLVFFGIFYLTGTLVNSPALNFLSSMFLVYGFVYSFPIKPLEGHFIWSSSKLLWLLITLPIFVAFMSFLDPAFGDIL